MSVEPGRRGPSPEAWDLKRGRIVQLYIHEDKKLHDVCDILSKEGFVASERMFKQRLSKWGVRKNAKSRKRSISKTETSETEDRSGYAQVERLPAEQPRTKRVALSNHSQFMDSANEDDANAIRSGELQPTATSNGAGTMPTADLPRHNHKFAQGTPLPTKGTKVLSCIREYYGIQRDRAVNDPGASARLQKDWNDAEEFWKQLKTGLYLINLELQAGNVAPGFAAVNKAFDKYSMQAISSEPYNCLRQLIVTLYPPTVQSLPGMRNQVLRDIRARAVENFDEKHPIAVICDELQLYEDNTDVSRAALKCMIQCIKQDERADRHHEVFRVLIDLVKIARRSKDIDLAREEAKELLKFTAVHFSKHSREQRTANRAYAHVLLEEKKWEEAEAYQRRSLDKPSEEEEPFSCQHHCDALAVSSMEDLAQITENLNRINDSIEWLEKAGALALLVHGKADATTTHIQEKLSKARSRSRSH